MPLLAAVYGLLSGFTGGIGSLPPVRWLLRREGRLPRLLVLSLVWFAVMLAALVNWMRTMYFAGQGRLLFTAAPAVALLLLLGWQMLLPRRLHGWLYRGLPILFMGLAVTQIGTLAASYRIPSADDQGGSYHRPLDAHLSGGMRILGIDLPNGGSVRAGGQLPLKVYFGTDEEITGFYTFFLHLATADDRLLYQFDGVPAQGRHPTRQWIPGQVFVDTYLIQVADGEGDELASLSLGFYDYRDAGQRQAVLDGEGVTVSDRVDAGPIRILVRQEQPDPEGNAPLAVWSGGIALLTADWAALPDGNRYRFQIVWRVEEDVHRDLTVFLQALDGDGDLLAKVDRKPQRGGYPTLTWTKGARIEDVLELILPGDEWQSVIIGLYDGNGARIPVEGSGRDHYVLMRKDDKAWAAPAHAGGQRP